MDRGFVIKNNDLLFEIYFSATSTHDDCYYSTQVVYSAMLPSMGKLHLALTHNNSVAGAPFGTFKGNFATFLNYVPDYCGFPWAMKSQFLEKPTIGKH